MKIDKQFILRKIVGDYVIIPTGKTALEFNGMITVNEQGAFLWDKLSKDTTEEQLAQAFVEEYETDLETARGDVKDFLKILRQINILTE